MSHGPCNACGSSDARWSFKDGKGSYCYSCQTYAHADSHTTEVDPRLTLTYSELPSRSVSLDTCRLYGYRVGTCDGRPCQAAPYHRNGELVGWKIRYPDKNFTALGSVRGADLWGQHLFEPGIRPLVITEGEIDAMSVWEATQWPAVSLPQGAGSAAKAIQKHAAWINSFQEVILLFDQDEQGQQAVHVAADLLDPTKVSVPHFMPNKDANDVLLEDGRLGLLECLQTCEEYSPPGILRGSSLLDRVLTAGLEPGVPYPHEGLNEKTGGFHAGELVVLTGATGGGKSTFGRETCWTLAENHKVGLVPLEESAAQAMRRFLSIGAGRKLKGQEDREEMEAQFKRVEQSLCVLDPERIDADILCSRVEYMRTVLGCEYVMIDHLSMLAGGEDERRDIDDLMRKLVSLKKRTGVGILLVAHLKRVEGRAHEDGGRVSLAHLRGSSMIEKMADTVVAVQRDQHGSTPNTLELWVLKSREDGQLGWAGNALYDPETGRLQEEQLEQL